jgi:hypothetical protein
MKYNVKLINLSSYFMPNPESIMILNQILCLAPMNLGLVKYFIAYKQAMKLLVRIDRLNRRKLTYMNTIRTQLGFATLQSC